MRVNYNQEARRRSLSPNQRAKTKGNDVKCLLTYLSILITGFTAVAGIVDDGNSPRYIYTGSALSQANVGRYITSDGWNTFEADPIDRIELHSVVSFDKTLRTQIFIQLKQLTGFDSVGLPTYGTVYMTLKDFGHPDEADLDQLRLENPHSELALFELTKDSHGVLHARLVSSKNKFDFTMSLQKRF